MTAMMTITNLGKTYGAKRALGGVNLEIAEGEVHGLIGPNGAGKTTLSACLSGELEPTEGTVVFRGKDITRLSPAQRARQGIGRSFQVSHVFAELTIEQNVAVAREGRTLRPLRALWSRRWDAVDDALGDVGLLSKRDEVAANLSQADRKRLELAMVLAMDPDLVILDEPTAGMGSNEAVECAELLARIAETRGTTMVITEHNMSVMFHLANRITVLDEGEVVMSGDPESVRNDDRLRTIYFGEMPTGGS